MARETVGASSPPLLSFPVSLPASRLLLRGLGLFSSFLHKNVWGKAKREASILGGISIFELVSCRQPSASLPGKAEGSVPEEGLWASAPRVVGRGVLSFSPALPCTLSLLAPVIGFSHVSAFLLFLKSDL